MGYPLYKRHRQRISCCWPPNGQTGIEVLDDPVSRRSVYEVRNRAPPASPSMYVISLCMTAVFMKPLSATRSPRAVSFSSLSPSLRGAAIALNAVACTLLFDMLDRDTSMRSSRIHNLKRRHTELSMSCQCGCRARRGIEVRLHDP